MGNRYCYAHYDKNISGGHSDLIGGVLISRDDEFMKKIMVQRDWFGGVLGPMEAWLAIRGLRTLDVRMQRHYENCYESS